MVPKHSLSFCLVSPVKSVFLEHPPVLAGEHMSAARPLLTRARELWSLEHAPLNQTSQPTLEVV